MAKKNNLFKNRNFLIGGLVFVMIAGAFVYKKMKSPEAPIIAPQTAVQAKAVRSYMTDISMSRLKERLIQVLTVLAIDRNAVIDNIDYLSQAIESHRIHLDAIILERKSGMINSIEYKNKIITLVREIASEVGIQLMDQQIMVNPRSYENYLRRNQNVQNLNYVAPGLVKRYYKTLRTT